MGMLVHLAWCLEAVGMVGWLSIQSPSPPPVPPAPVPRTVQRLPPLPPSPIAFFRKLLAASPPERVQTLAGYSAVHRQSLEAKLKEYAALKPEDRELRLRVLEVRWYLLPLMRMDPSRQIEALPGVPENDRPLIERRLAQWNHLPPDLQKEVFDNERMLNYFTRVDTNSSATVLPPSPEPLADGHQAWEENLARWRALPKSQREQMLARFRHFFELTPTEKQKTLRLLSQSDRQQVALAVETLEKLAPLQRQQYLDAFNRYSNFTPEQREEFLENAKRWLALPSSERQKWRDLDRRLPPLPPGFNEPPPPPGFRRPNAPPASFPALPGTN